MKLYGHRASTKIYDTSVEQKLNLYVLMMLLNKTEQVISSSFGEGIGFQTIFYTSMLRGLTGGFLLLRNFSVTISVSPHVCFILVLILISMFLR